jgi:hypothetical protein
MFSEHNLYLDLKRMEAAYTQSKPHDFEITKLISLRQLDPEALIRLRTTGEARFFIPEVPFDFDFPGDSYTVAVTLRLLRTSQQCS